MLVFLSHAGADAEQARALKEALAAPADMQLRAGDEVTAVQLALAAWPREGGRPVLASKHLPKNAS